MFDETSDKSPLAAFLQRYWNDREEGSVRELHEYLSDLSVLLRGCPGDDTIIARKYMSLQAGKGAAVETDARLGPYELMEELGRGGQGVVYRARDTRLGREIALKVLRGFGTIPEELLARFKREAAVASRLDHPHICTVYEAGDEGGVPYIAMQLVEGEPLDHKIRTAREGEASDSITCMDLEGPDVEENTTDDEESSTPGRDQIDRILSLFESLADALATAHECGVIHRDVKPGNIIVRPDGRPVIMDFGLARDLESDLATLTRTGDLFGTPAYMSPEQLTRGTISVDARSDIWSLGASLYEALTLRRPFEAATREALYQAIHTKEPVPPRRLNPAIPRELDIVVSCTLEKDRDRRYQTAAALAEDLRRVRRKEPIQARPAGPTRRVLRWAERNRAIALAVAMTLIAVLSALAVSRVSLSQARKDRDRAETAGRLLAGSLAEKSRLLQEVTVEKAAREKVLSEKTDALDRVHGLRLLAESRSALANDPTLALLLALEGHERAPGFAANMALIDALASPRELWSFREMKALRVTRSGTLLALNKSSQIEERNVATGDLIRTLGLPKMYRSDGRTVFFSDDESRVAVLDSGQTVRLWDLVADTEIPCTLPRRLTIGLALSRDGSRLLRIGKKHATVYDVDSGDVLQAIDTAATQTSERPSSLHGTKFIFGPDGGRLIAIGAREARVWEIGEEAPRVFEVDGWRGVRVSDARGSLAFLRSKNLQSWEPHKGTTPQPVSIDGDPTRLLAANVRRDQLLVEVDDRYLLVSTSGTSAPRNLDLGGSPEFFGFTPDGTRVISSNGSGMIEFWNVEDGTLTGRIRIPHERPHNVLVNSDSTIVLVQSGPGSELRAWRMPGSTEGGPLPVAHTGAISPDGRLGALIPDPSAPAKDVTIWDLRTNRPAQTLPAEFPLKGAAFSANGRLVGLTDSKSRVSIWDIQRRQRVALLQNTTDMERNAGVLTFGPESKRVAVLCSGVINVWNIETSDLVASWATELDVVGSIELRFSAGGRQVLVQAADPGINPVLLAVRPTALFVRPTAMLLDIASEDAIEFAPGIDGPHRTLSVSESHFLAVSIVGTEAFLASSPEARLWRAPGVWAAKLGPGGRFVIVRDKNADRLLDAKSGERIWPAKGTSTQSRVLALGDEDRVMVTVQGGSKIVVWDLHAGRPQIAFDSSRVGKIRWVRVSNDGNSLLVGGQTGTAAWTLCPAIDARRVRSRPFTRSELLRFEIEDRGTDEADK